MNKRLGTVMGAGLALLASCAFAADDGASGERSIALVLKERDEQASRLLQLKGEMQDVEEVRRHAQFAIEALRRHTMAEEVVNSAVARIEVVKLHAKASTLSFKMLEDLCDASDNLRNEFFGLTSVDVEQRGRLRFPVGLASTVPALAQIGGQSVEVPRLRSPSTRRRGPTDTDPLKSNSLCFSRVSGESPTAEERRQIASALLEAAGSIDAKEISARFQRAAEVLTQPWQAAVTGLNELNGRQITERDDVINRIKALDREVGNADSRLRAQEAVDSKLVYATYGMIAVLFILGIMLIRSDRAFTSVLIENRTIVELVSIGFMLMTIIILGAGKRLSGDTLGALLGTIGGYVFGREVARRRDETGSPKALPAPNVQTGKD